MTGGLPAAVCERIRGVLAGHPEVAQAILYGSRARGNHRPNSDIDLVLMGGEDLTLQVLTRVMNELDDLLLPYDIEVSLFSQLREPVLRRHIQNCGIALYQKSQPHPELA